MSSAEKIKRLFAKSNVTVNSEVDDRIINDALTAFDKSEKAKRFSAEPNIWRIIMRSRITKLAAAAALFIAGFLSITFLDKSATPAWAIEQSTAALGNIETVIVYGKSNHIAPLGNFDIRLKRDTNNWDSFRVHVESDDVVFIVNDNMWYEYTLGCGEIYAKNMESLSDFGAKVWGEIVKNAPWMSPLSPTMLEATKLISGDWQETYAVDDRTGRDCVFVSGGYKPLSASFWIVFDLQSKLMVRAKYWTNPYRNGIPAVEIEKINYNQEISDEIFDPEKFTEANVINKEEREKRFALFRQAHHLAAKKQYRESIEIFSQLYEKYPHFIKTPLALQYIGECYRRLGQHEKAIEFFNKVLREYSAPKNAIANAYRLLGCSYMSIEQDTKALKNFEMCLEFITQWDPEGMRYPESYRKQVEENIEELKNKNK